MADVKITDLTEYTSAPALTDLLETVIDPGGTPLSRKLNYQRLFNAAGNLDTVSPALADALFIVQSSVAKKATPQALLDLVGSLTEDTDGALPGASDELMLYKGLASAARRVAVENFLKGYFNATFGLASETAPAGADQILMYDDGAGAVDRITLANLLKVVNDLSAETSLDGAADYVLLYDAGASAAKKVLLNTLDTGLRTLWVPAVAMWVPTTNGAATFNTELATNDVQQRGLAFDQTTKEKAQFSIGFPKSWNLGTVTFRPFWTATGGTGGVVWSLAGRALTDDDAMDQAYGTAQTSTDTRIANNDMHVGPTSSAITITGTPADADLCMFEVGREVANGSDTLTSDAILLGIQVFFTTSSRDDA